MRGERMKTIEVVVFEYSDFEKANAEVGRRLNDDMLEELWEDRFRVLDYENEKILVDADVLDPDQFTDLVQEAFCLEPLETEKLVDHIAGLG